MTEISEIRNIIYRVRDMSDRATKLGYLKKQPREVLQLLSGSINMNSIGPSIMDEIRTGPNSLANVSQVIEAFDVASKVSGNDKRAILRQVILIPEDKECIYKCLFENLLLGISVPTPDPIFPEPFYAELCGSMPFDPEEHIIEEKYDGIRCIAIKANREVILYSRNKRIINAEVIAEELKGSIPDGTAIDGELVAPNGEFQSLNRHETAILRVFDIPFVNYQKNTARLKKRRQMLEDILLETEHVKLSRILDLKTMKEIQEWVDTNKVEGVVAKRPDSKYAYGSRAMWQKFKPFTDIKAKVVGITQGTGKRAHTIGAIEVIPEGLSKITKVGTGFSDQDLLDVEDMFLSGVDIEVDVKYQQITDEGCLRHPVFLKVR